MTINEETYGQAGAAFYDEYFPVDERALETAEFLAQRARETGASEPIALELGIGTGRVALPLAEHGVKVFGVDLASGCYRSCRASRKHTVYTRHSAT